MFGNVLMTHCIRIVLLAYNEADSIEGGRRGSGITTRDEVLGFLNSKYNRHNREVG